MIIQWNITEVLSKIELRKEGEGVGLNVPESDNGMGFSPNEKPFPIDSV